MKRAELLAELGNENQIGVQLLQDLVPDVDIHGHIYTELLRRHPDDPTATDAEIQLHLLTRRGLIICRCLSTASMILATHASPS